MNSGVSLPLVKVESPLRKETGIFINTGMRNPNLISTPQLKFLIIRLP
jgi:hypothetical protein